MFAGGLHGVAFADRMEEINLIESDAPALSGR